MPPAYPACCGHQNGGAAEEAPPSRHFSRADQFCGAVPVAGVCVSVPVAGVCVSGVAGVAFGVAEVSGVALVSGVAVPGVALVSAGGVVLSTGGVVVCSVVDGWVAASFVWSLESSAGSQTSKARTRPAKRMIKIGQLERLEGGSISSGRRWFANGSVAGWFALSAGHAAGLTLRFSLGSKR